MIPVAGTGTLVADMPGTDQACNYLCKAAHRPNVELWAQNDDLRNGVWSRGSQPGCSIAQHYNMTKQLTMAQGFEGMPTCA